MKTEIKDVLHLYLGCEANVEVSEYYEAGQGKIISIDLEGEVCVISNKSTKYCVEAAFHDIIPILSKLPDMTEEECWEWQREFTFFHVSDDEYGRAYIEGRLHVIKDRVISSERMFRPEQTAWLLSKGFDLFGLIEQGLAIDKATLKA
jgi:hypothetical protein